jgi:hydrogenase maturation protein HypF
LSQPISSVSVRRLQLALQGVVQGVGFRPFVYRLARELGLSGSVQNTAGGIRIEVEGPEHKIAEFQCRLESEKPRLASIQSSRTTPLAPQFANGFEILRSEFKGSKTALILPDLATCADCLHEVLDPRNRRFRYPFTNCTLCGPRFSILEALPYDRANTSMKRFIMCEACRSEFENPADRRFHAQPNACVDCGPHVELWDSSGRPLAARDPALRKAATMIRDGAILALKGLGGFQLIVDARNQDAIKRLRRRKRREEKPFALMVPSWDPVEKYCECNDLESTILQSPKAPIVLLRRRKDVRFRIADAVAPRNPNWGIMLPYTPLHHLLLDDLGFPVVATSGNLSDEPICTNEHEGLVRLQDIADGFLVHDRPIVRPIDDSVVCMMHGRRMVLRRARGFAPLPIRGPHSAEPILALGAHQKNTVALAIGENVFMSQHIGDLVTQEALAAFDGAVRDLPRLYDAEPRIVACDLHPDYHSTHRAESMVPEPIGVSHHHAHVVSCMVDNGLDGPVLGVSWDGTGFGPDGTVWGGEFLRCDLTDFERGAHLRYFPLPGGERAAHEPCRSALGLLYEVFGAPILERRSLAPLRAFNESQLRILSRVLQQRLNCPVTSSAGRLFDAVASIAGVRQRVSHEGQAAMELQFAAETDNSPGAYPFIIRSEADRSAAHKKQCSQSGDLVDWAPMVEPLLDDVERNEPLGRVARRFHNMLAEMITAVAHRIGLARVVLSGGCFQNRLLTERTIDRLQDEGFQPFWHQSVPPNDGGVALGQAIVASMRRNTGESCA